MSTRMCDYVGYDPEELVCPMKIIEGKPRNLYGYTSITAHSSSIKLADVSSWRLWRTATLISGGRLGFYKSDIDRRCCAMGMHTKLPEASSNIGAFESSEKAIIIRKTFDKS